MNPEILERLFGRLETWLQGQVDQIMGKLAAVYFVSVLLAFGAGYLAGKK